MSKITATESRRILQESTGNSGKWKQYSDRKFIGFLPVDSSQFPVLSGRKRSEIIGKNPKNFRWGYCFHVPAISGAFLSEPASNFRPGNVFLLRPFDIDYNYVDIQTEQVRLLKRNFSNVSLKYFSLRLFSILINFGISFKSIVQFLHNPGVFWPFRWHLVQVNWSIVAIGDEDVCGGKLMKCN